MKVLVSYATDDLDACRAVLHALAAAGHEPWVDFERIGQVDGWLDLVVAAMEGRSAIVAIMSPASDGSANCEQERDAARRVGKPIVSVVLAGAVNRRHPIAGEVSLLDDGHREDLVAYFRYQMVEDIAFYHHVNSAVGTAPLGQHSFTSNPSAVAP